MNKEASQQRSSSEAGTETSCICSGLTVEKDELLEGSSRRKTQIQDRRKDLKKRGGRERVGQNHAKRDIDSCFPNSVIKHVTSSPECQ